MNTMQLNPMDLATAVRRLPVGAKYLMMRHGANALLAGGFIRSCVANEKINDVDLFTTSAGYAKRLCNELAEGREVITTKNAYTLPGEPYSVQFIHRWTYPRPEAALERFDFTMARAAIWYDLGGPGRKAGWQSLCDVRFYGDLCAKRLVYVAPERDEEAGASMLRILKFYQRGYRIPLDSLALCLARIMHGADEALGLAAGQDYRKRAEALQALLCEVDPQVDPTHDAHLPSAAAT